MRWCWCCVVLLCVWLGLSDGTISSTSASAALFDFANPPIADRSQATVKSMGASLVADAHGMAWWLGCLPQSCASSSRPSPSVRAAPAAFDALDTSSAAPAVGTGNRQSATTESMLISSSSRPPANAVGARSDRAGTSSAIPRPAGGFAGQNLCSLAWRCRARPRHRRWCERRALARAPCPKAPCSSGSAVAAKAALEEPLPAALAPPIRAPVSAAAAAPIRHPRERRAARSVAIAAAQEARSRA